MWKYLISPSFWFAVSVICLIMEILLPGFFVATFSLASLITSVAAFYTKDLNFLLLIFSLSSLLIFFLARPLYFQFLLKNPESVKFGFQSLVGKVGVVSQGINLQQSGSIKIDGDVWTAHSTEVLEAGEQALIYKIEGNSVWVKALS
jgi:membrane protein implicated in regulation of membrane protease activity